MTREDMLNKLRAHHSDDGIDAFVVRGDYYANAVVSNSEGDTLAFDDNGSIDIALSKALAKIGGGAG